MLAVRLCGPRVVMRHAVNLAAGRTIWRPPLAILALQNLIDAAGREARRRGRQPQDGTLAPTG